MEITALASVQLILSWLLVVLIWLVQIIVYPGFQWIAAADFPAYHRWYVARITALVLPLMLAEAATLVLWTYAGASYAVVLPAAALLALVWASTMGLQVPLHHRLAQGKDTSLIRRLVMSNWIRTGAWSAKALWLSLQ